MKKIAVLAGDGIGPEVMKEALRVLTCIAEQDRISLKFTEGYIGGAAFDKFGTHFPEETKTLCEASDAILFGSVGGPVMASHEPKWKQCEVNSILALRKAFSFNANFRPAKVYPILKDISPLKPSLLEKGVDILVLRELIGDIYFGEHKRFEKNNLRCASDVAEYNENQIISVANRAFQAARQRRQKVTSVDKANVLDTSRLWREVVSEVAQEYPDVTLEHMLVDNCAMQLIMNPNQFDVILTANLFGDILSDAASVIPGSLGLMPSASFNEEGFALYEPSGGSAPDIAGKNIANPIAQILSAAMMLRFSFELEESASRIEKAVQKTLEKGYRTRDIQQADTTVLGSREFTDKILDELIR